LIRLSIFDLTSSVSSSCFLSASDIADNSGPYFPPEQFRRFILPYLSEWAGHIRTSGGYSILHTDGNISMYIEEIAETPLHALQAIDPVAGMDIVETKKQAGSRLCLCGNLDCRIATDNDPSEIYDTASSLLRSMAATPGYVFGTSNVLERTTPKEHYDVIMQAYSDHNI